MGTAGSVNLNEDALYTFAASDFGFTDPSDTPPPANVGPANALLAVKITTIPGKGMLKAAAILCCRAILSRWPRSPAAG